MRATAKTLRQRWNRLSYSNQTILILLVIAAIFWPMIIRGIPGHHFQTFIAAILLTWYGLNLLYYGEQTE
jgi:Ca2+/H+ antiporter